MKTKKKGRFLTFCFSLMPGVAEMYMGFMKTGISLMFAFIMLIIFTTWLRLGALPAICIVVWFYGFFHANHLACLSDEEFEQVKDGYLFGLDDLPEIKIAGGKYRKWVAYILIFAGVCFLWNSLADLMYDTMPEAYRFVARIMWKFGNYAPRLLIGVGIIAMGVKMISGRKVERESELRDETKNEAKNEPRTDGEGRSVFYIEAADQTEGFEDK